MTTTTPAGAPEPSVFFSVFRGLVGKDIIVELKNGVSLRGTLRATDPTMNMFLENIDADRVSFPMLVGITSMFIRASVVHYIQLPPDGVNINKLTAQCATEK